MSWRMQSDEPPHDVLAAEAFAVPAPDPDRHGPVVPPDDPLGVPEPHDVLAAEEFPMPAVRRARSATLTQTAQESFRPMLAAFVGVLLGAALLRALRRR